MDNTDQGDNCFGGNKLKDFSRTFKHPRDLLPNLFHGSTTVFVKWHSFYSIKSQSNADVDYTAHGSPM